jgi:hypothetical protein
MVVAEARLCRLEALRGRPEECTEACPFWEADRCVFEQIDLADNTLLAGWLADVRRALEHAQAREGEHEARRLFYQALNDGQGE